MAERLLIHPHVDILLKRQGIRNEVASELEAISAAQDGYRKGSISKTTVADTIVAHFLKIHKKLFVDPAQNHARDHIAGKFNAEILPRNSVSHHRYNSFVTEGKLFPLSSMLPTTDVICAVFNKRIGMAIADFDTFTPENLKPAINIVLDRPDFDIPDAFLGLGQLPMHGWIHPQGIEETFAATLKIALREFTLMSGNGSLQTTPEIFFTGLEPWKQFDLVEHFNGTIERTLAAFPQLFGDEETADFGIEFKYFPGSAAIIYGGIMDPDFPQPNYLTPASN